jgi:hypothetical protein
MNLAILKVIGIVLFLYFSWRDLRDNYKEDNLISYGWMSILAFLVGSRIGFGLINFGVWNENILDWFSIWTKPGMNFYIGYLFMLFVTWIISKKEGWKYLSFLEDLTKNFLILFFFLMLDEFTRTRFSLMTGLFTLVIAVGWIVANIIKQKYRSFVWYRSGRKGFVFLFINGLVFLMLLLVSWYLKTGLKNYIIFLATSLISLVGLFILGEVFEPLMVNIKRRKNERAKE